VKISKRTLSQTEAEIISQAIALTPNIIGYRPAELKNLENVLVIENRSGITGVLAYVETRTFIDLKLFIILERFRDRGFGAKLFDSFMSAVGDSGKPIYAITKNPAVIHLLTKNGFTKVGFMQLPLPCVLHQTKMIFSLYRVKEFARKTVRFPRSQPFSYWIKRP
jgi:GNAT superfamily N-acetyltransferase